jgi:hypothetical protein
MTAKNVRPITHTGVPVTAKTRTAPSPTRAPIEKRKAADNRLRGPLENFAGHKVTRLLGYWALVQTYGGWRGVAEQPFWSEGTVQKWRLEFREVFGMEAEDYVPEVGPILRQAFYGDPEGSRSTPGAEDRQAEALVVLNATKAARKGAKK